MRSAGKNLVAIDGTMDAIAALRVTVMEKGRRALPDHIRIQHRDAVREHIACHNPLCQNGGFSLGEILREMVRGRQPEFIGTSFCTGQEGDLEKPETLTSCATRFEVEATVRLR